MPKSVSPAIPIAHEGPPGFDELAQRAQGRSLGAKLLQLLAALARVA